MAKERQSNLSPTAGILADLVAVAAKPLTQATAMPEGMYASPDILAREVKQLFYRDWICAGRSDEVAAEGDCMSFDICDQPVVIVRRGDGECLWSSDDAACRADWQYP